MIKVSPEDAFALALIAQRPKDNKDLVATLSHDAKPIGAALAKNTVNKVNEDLQKTIEKLQKWAGTASE